MRNSNDTVRIVGYIHDYESSYTTHGELMRKIHIAVARDSGTLDLIPTIIPERLYDKDLNEKEFIVVEGSLRSHNDNGKLLVAVFADEIEFPDIEHYHNFVKLDGFICKSPVYRETPLGRKVCDIMLAINHNYRKSSYIPNIVWGRNAKFASTLNVGTHIRVLGRLQSREYTKKYEDGRTEIKMTYEVSVNNIEVITDEEENNNDKQDDK